MKETVITIRRPGRADAAGIAGVHDCAWRDAYRGVIPGRELERMIARRGPRWWDAAIARGSRLLALRANDDETQTRREFTLEGRGHNIRWLCPF